MKARRPTRPTSALGGLLALVFGFAFIGVISSCLITIGIWPGQVKLLAPLFCSDAQPDAFVVADTYNPRPGETVTNFSLYCMGPRGDATDHGFLWPFLAISVVNGVAILVLLSLFGLVGRTRRKAKSERAHAEVSGGADPDAEASVVSAESDGDDRGSPFDLGNQGGRTPPSPGSTPGPFVD